MRKTLLTIHNNQTLEMFVGKRADGFELWIVGPIKGSRTVLDHHLTHDNLEARLHYAHAGDVIWHNATRSEIPTEKHDNAIEMEETITRGKFLDYEQRWEAEGLSVISHFAAIEFLVADRKETSSAKRALIGEWTDGVVTLRLERNNRLQWSCSDYSHPLNIGNRIHGHAPDWWNFAMWRLHLMNEKQKCGTHVGVLRVDNQELHLQGASQDRLAHVFSRIYAQERSGG